MKVPAKVRKPSRPGNVLPTADQYLHRSESARKGWETRRATIARRAELAAEFAHKQISEFRPTYPAKAKTRKPIAIKPDLGKEHLPALLMATVFNRALSFGGSPNIVENFDGSVDGELRIPLSEEDDYNKVGLSLEQFLDPIPGSFWVMVGAVSSPPQTVEIEKENYLMWTKGGALTFAHPQPGDRSAENFETARGIVEGLSENEWDKPSALVVRLVWSPKTVKMADRINWKSREI